jgi:hypothetical protein
MKTLEKYAEKKEVKGRNLTTDRYAKTCGLIRIQIQIFFQCIGIGQSEDPHLSSDS